MRYHALATDYDGTLALMASSRGKLSKLWNACSPPAEKRSWLRGAN